MREAFFLLGAFLHDLATGFWLACFFLLAVVPCPESLGFLRRALFISLLAVFLTGFPRLLEARENPPSPLKKKFLLLKHLLLIPLLLGGTLWIWLF